MNREIVDREALLKEMNYFYEQFDKTVDDDEKIVDSERELGALLVDILLETDLPKFSAVDVLSVKNDTVEEKMANLRRITELQGNLWPASLNDASLDLSKNSSLLKTEPFVNNIHAWNLILNLANGISSQQSLGADFSPDEIFAITRDLYRFTTNYRKLSHLRGDVHVQNGQEFPETGLRRDGVEGRNGGRHITKLEMIKQLQVLKESFKRK